MEEKKGKVFKKIDEQISIYEDRNLKIDDYDYTKNVLINVNYYRLSGYALSMKDKERFKEGSTFKKLYDLYEFDRKLRTLILTIIEQIEISLRTQIAYEFSRKYGPLGYEESKNFTHQPSHSKFMSEFRKNTQKSKELYTFHHNKEYDGQFPLWVAVELFTFGMLSTFYKNMHRKDRKLISQKYYNLGNDSLESWLHCITYIRNCCAHYARIYNKVLVIKPKLPDEIKIRNDKLLAVLFIIKKLSLMDNAWRTFLTSFKALMEEYGESVEYHHIGFTKNWEEVLNKP